MGTVDRYLDEQTRNSRSYEKIDWADGREICRCRLGKCYELRGIPGRIFEEKRGLWVEQDECIFRRAEISKLLKSLQYAS